VSTGPRTTGRTVSASASILLALGLVGVGLAVGCSAVGGGQPGPGERTQLTVFVASSLQDAFDDLSRAYEASHPGVRLVASFDASSRLRTQVEQGAPADLFLSADVATGQQLETEGLAQAPQTFARNRLTIVVPKGNPASIHAPIDLGRPGVRLITALAGVPIATYADEAIARLAGPAGYGGQWASRVRANIVSREPDARAVVTKVELNEADAAIVYATDRRDSVESIQLPPPADVLAEYAASATVGARLEPAHEFLAWLLAPHAQEILAGYGFLPPG
jgi:molybdate transport system substrate-binding protein